jgi:type IV secretory pathway VirB2 component (pilin)
MVAPLTVAMAGVAHAAGAGTSPMAAVFTTVEGWLTGDIAEWLGICAIVGLGALIWFAHDYGHIFGYMFKGILAVAVVVFAITEYTTAFGAGATIGGTSVLAYAAYLPSIIATAVALSLTANALSKHRHVTA